VPPIITRPLDKRVDAMTAAGVIVEFPCGAGEAIHGDYVALVDFNGDSQVDLSDAVGLLLHLFRSGGGHVLGMECTAIVGCGSVCSEEG